MPTRFPSSLLRCALGALVLTLSIGAAAAQAGFRSITVPGLGGAGAPPIPVALYYPTEAPEHPVSMGIITGHVALHAEPEPSVKGLILLSHGQAGSELGSASIAESLARHGYLVAALRHPGDNWQDTSLISHGAARYLADRPQQASKVIDAILADPEWKSRIAADARGPRVAAVGHSAGGYTVLALAGGVPGPARVSAHCAAHRAEDPILCRSVPAAAPAGPAQTGTTTADPIRTLPPLADARVRAVAALAPLGVPFTPQSLAAIRIPVWIEAGEADHFLVPAFHARYIAQNMPGAELRMVPNASHWAFMDTPGIAIMTPDGDVREDPPGFDRQHFLKQLGNELSDFFDRALAKQRSAAAT